MKGNMEKVMLISPVFEHVMRYHVATIAWKMANGIVNEIKRATHDGKLRIMLEHLL